MVPTVKPECAVLRDQCPPEPGPQTMHVTILGAEATGRMIVAELSCGCGVKGEILANATTFGAQIAALLAGHPEVRRLIVFMREDMGVGLEQLSQWVDRGQKSEAGGQRPEARTDRSSDTVSPMK